MTTADIGVTIADMEIFDGLADDDRALLAAHLHRTLVPANTYVMSLEQPGDVVYIITDGAVRVQAEQEDGSLVILALLSTGDVLGEMSALDSAGRSATVVTLEPCELLWLDRDTFLNYLRTHPVLAYNVLRVMSRRLRLANERIQALATLDVAGRVAGQLAAFAVEYGRPTTDGGRLIPFRLTQSELSDLVGASRERVNQVLGVLRRAGLIDVDAQLRITVRDVDALRRRAR
jgi:CRP/FNR family cyclic AMP-dependent transcriptional regulator